MSDIDPLKFPHQLKVTIDESMGERAEDVCLVMAAQKIQCPQGLICFTCKKFTDRNQEDKSNEFERDCRKTFWQRSDYAVYYATQLKSSVALGKLQLWDRNFDKTIPVPTQSVNAVPNSHPSVDGYYKANPFIKWVQSGWIAKEDLRVFCNYERFRVDFLDSDEGDNLEHSVSKEIATIVDATDSTLTQTTLNTVEISTPKPEAPIEIKAPESHVLPLVKDKSSESLDAGDTHVPRDTSDGSLEVKADKKQKNIEAEVKRFSSRPDESFITIEVVADLLNMSPATVERMVKKGLLVKHRTSSRGVGYKVGEIRAYMKSIAKDR